MLEFDHVVTLRENGVTVGRNPMSGDDRPSSVVTVSVDVIDGVAYLERTVHHRADDREYSFPCPFVGGECVAGSWYMFREAIDDRFFRSMTDTIALGVALLWGAESVDSFHETCLEFTPDANHTMQPLI